MTWMKNVMLEHRFTVSIGSVVEYVSGIVYVMVWLVCRFIWVVKMGWGLKVWVGIYVVWLKMCVWWSCLNYFYN